MISSSLYANISVSNKSNFESLSNNTIKATNFITNTMTTNYIMGEDTQSITIDGNSQLLEPTTSNDIITFEYIEPIGRKNTHPFRYTEVSFFIAFPFVYTYALLAVTGFDMLESFAKSDMNRSAYKQLQTSELLFTFIGATFAAAAIGYANYSRVYGKKSRENKPSFSFSPTVETIGRQTGAGFIFSFSYPYSF